MFQVKGHHTLHHIVCPQYCPLSLLPCPKIPHLGNCWKPVWTQESWPSPSSHIVERRMGILRKEKVWDLSWSNIHGYPKKVLSLGKPQKTEMRKIHARDSGLTLANSFPLEEVCVRSGGGGKRVCQWSELQESCISITKLAWSLGCVPYYLWAGSYLVYKMKIMSILQICYNMSPVIRFPESAWYVTWTWL